MPHWSQALPRDLRELAAELWLSCDEVSSDGARWEEPQPIRILPEGGADLLLSIDAGPGRSLREFSLYGPQTRPRTVSSPVPVDNVRVRLQPHAIAQLFGQAAHEFRDEIADLRDLWGATGRELALRLLDAEPSRRPALLAAALRLRRPAGPPSPAEREALDAVRRLERSQGTLSVSSLCAQTGIGERRLERLLRHAVGVSPRRLASLIRFRRACERLRAGESQADVALACGYFDQSHLQREFRRFAGVAPGRHFARAERAAGSAGAAARTVSGSSKTRTRSSATIS